MDLSREPPLQHLISANISNRGGNRTCSCQNKGKRPTAIFLGFAAIFMTVCIGFILTQRNESFITNDMESLIKRVERLEDLCGKDTPIVKDDKSATSNRTRVQRSALNGDNVNDGNANAENNISGYGDGGYDANGNGNFNQGSGDSGNYNGNKNGNGNYGSGSNGNENGNLNQGPGSNGNNNGNNNQGSANNGNSNGNGNQGSGSNNGGVNGGDGNNFGFPPTGPSSGSSFVVWGKRRCPQTSRSIYNGYAAAASPLKGSGGSTKLECLPFSPTFQSNRANLPAATTLISPVKFSLADQRSVDGSLVQCSVCYTTSSPTVMIAGRSTCPGNSWIREYTGHLMSTPGKSGEFYYSSENYCVDLNPDTLPGHSRSSGQQLTYVQAGTCLSNQYPCNKYTRGHKIACTVCTRA